jgi:transcriptional regulator with XRE-family HTH domain
MRSEGDRWRTELRDARKRLGISQRVLAEQTGISFEAIRGYESGRRNATRDRLEALIAALKIPNATANIMRESAGFATVNFLFAGEHPRDFFYSLEELPAAVEETPWPQFVVNDAFEIVCANAWICAVWDVDFAEEQRTRTRAQMNVLSVASDHRFADRLKNWDEMIAMFVSIFKAPSPTSYSLDAPSPYFNEVISQFLNGDPVFLARLLEIWKETKPRKPKVRSSYPIVWEHPEFGVMRFRGVITNASYPDALSFNDWIPLDAETWQVLTKARARHDSASSERRVIRHRRPRP